ncbi:hypothetical protein ACLB2K_053521 [Fragaria x ananassa]
MLQLAVISAFLGPDQIATETLLATDPEVLPWVQKYQRSRETVVGGGVILSETVFTARPLAAIQALMLFKKLYPEHRREEIENCIVRAAEFIEKIQATDEDCSSISKACDFLLSKELASGGWGESYLSCQNKEYSNLKDNRPHIVNTAWAMLALLGAGQVLETLLKDDFISQSRINSEDPFRRNTILSALGPPALTVLFPAAQEQLPRRSPILGLL